MLSSPKLPLFIACSLVNELRELILPLDFNALVLLFSRMPPVNIRSCVDNALKIMHTTPPSIAEQDYRMYNSDNLWWEVKKDVSDIEAEIYPRLSIDDIKNDNFTGTIVDIRPVSEYKTVYYPGSIHIEPNEEAVAEIARRCHQEHITLLGDDNKCKQVYFALILIYKLAQNLVEAHVPYVSILNGGIEAFEYYAPSLLKRDTQI